MLVAVPFYKIPRNEDNRREQIYDRMFELALRWEPFGAYDPSGEAVDYELVVQGRTILNRLVQGDAISQEHLDRAFEYLEAALSYYEQTDYEPYPGRNKEAYDNLLELRTELRSSFTT
jgi:hypothetical protein